MKSLLTTLLLIASLESFAGEDFVPGAELRLVNLSSHRVDYKFGQVGFWPVNAWQQYNRVGLEPNESTLLNDRMIPCNSRFCVEIQSFNPRDPSVLEYFNENHRENFVTFLKGGVAVVIDVAITQKMFDEESEFRTHIQNFIIEHKEEGKKRAVQYLSDLDLKDGSLESNLVKYIIKNSGKISDTIIKKASKHSPDILMSYILAKFMLDYAIDKNSDNWLNELRKQFPKTVDLLATAGCFIIHKQSNKFYKFYSDWALANSYAAVGVAAAKISTKGSAYYSKYLYDTKKTTSGIIETEKEGVYTFGHNQRVEVIVTDYNQYTVSMKIRK